MRFNLRTTAEFKGWKHKYSSGHWIAPHLKKENKMQVFEYVIVYEPLQTKEQRDAGEEADEPKFLSDGIECIIAKDLEQAKVLAARAIPDAYIDRLSHIRTIIRPFA